MEFSYTWHRAASSSQNHLEDEKIPEHSLVFRNLYNLRHDIDLDLAIFFTSHTSQTASISRSDLRLAYRPVEQLELSLTVSNITDPEHVESIKDGTKANSEVLRQGLLKLSYGY